VHEVIGEHDVSRRSLWKLCERGQTENGSEKKTRSERDPRCAAQCSVTTTTRSSCCNRTFGQVFERDVVEPLDLLHDQLLLIDLDHERGVPFVSREPELADRIFQFLGYVYGVGLGHVRDGEKMENSTGYQRGGRTMSS